MAVEGKITCDKCGEGYPLKLEMASRDTFHANLPVGFERLDKMLQPNEGSNNRILKHFTVCGPCLADHRRQVDRLFELHFEKLK